MERKAGAYARGQSSMSGQERSKIQSVLERNINVGSPGLPGQLNSNHYPRTVVLGHYEEAGRALPGTGNHKFSPKKDK